MDNGVNLPFLGCPASEVCSTIVSPERQKKAPRRAPLGCSLGSKADEQNRPTMRSR